MNRDLEKSFRINLTIFIIGIFSGIHFGAASIREAHKEEREHNQKIVSNCIEVVIGKKPKGKICQK